MYEVCIPESFYRGDLIVFHVRGDSMEPNIKEGAFVGVDIQVKEIVGGKAYAVWIPYEGVTIKLVYVDPENNQFILRSENAKHPDQRLPIDDRDNLIIGRVVWVMQEV
jgi:phage repressor protein C with HTH and peptisase S24 domain